MLVVFQLVTTPQSYQSEDLDPAKIILTLRLLLTTLQHTRNHQDTTMRGLVASTRMTLRILLASINISDIIKTIVKTKIL